MDRQQGKAPVRGWIVAIAYDGERTEADYFTGWRRALGQDGLLLKPYWVSSGGNAKSAITEAIRKFKQDPDFDEAWCVCDTDDCSPADVAQARALAAKAGVNLCLSTRSFEVWLALHWGKISTAPISSETEAVQLVSQHFERYSARNKSVPFSVLGPRSGDACRNADWLKKQGVENPATEMQNVVRAMIKQGRRARR